MIDNGLDNGQVIGLIYLCIEINFWNLISMMKDTFVKWNTK